VAVDLDGGHGLFDIVEAGAVVARGAGVALAAEERAVRIGVVGGAPAGLRRCGG
jgi:hypothetical protein